MKITIVNAKTDLGVNVDGSNLGPEILSNYFKNNKKIGKIVNIEKSNKIKSKIPNDLAKNLKEVNNFNQALYKEIVTIKNNNNFPIILGGDHSLAIASSLGSISKEKALGIIWIDAHLDYNTFDTTITGNLHGLPLATINGLNKKLSLFHEGNYYKPENTVVIGYRSEEENKEIELNNAKSAGITVFTTEDIKIIGVKTVLEKAFKIATTNTVGVHISYDLDVIDPNICPGVSVPELNGISENDAYLITDELLNYKDNIKSFDLVEFNPINDIDKKTENIAVNILNKIIKKH